MSVCVCVCVQARQQAQLKHQVAEDSKNEYLTYLQKFNKEQNEHYYTLIPHIFQVLCVCVCLCGGYTCVYNVCVL